MHKLASNKVNTKQEPISNKYSMIKDFLSLLESLA